ncbi:NUDIX hydrolase [Pyruvatibacter sp.]|uniref:NUDIX hydrolase n=1 Tax=Pyruvatibacter sp. TaxID=1981328 RepID=UPI0032EB93EA
MTDKKAEKPLIPAATILMLRDGDTGLEVFMVVRHHQIDFASGALVFPGGKLAPGDKEPKVRGLCDGADGLDDTLLALRVGAIREAFEESGVLLARDAGGAVIDGPRLSALEADRPLLDKGELAIGDFLERETLRLACDMLHPYSHWITPKMMPKRFDTHFYLADAPADHVAMHDGSEGVDSVWINPSDALREADEGKRTIIFPTRMNLEKLAESKTVAEAMAAAKARSIVTVEPVVEDVDGTMMLKIPAEAGYSVTQIAIDKMG